ncbi:hypothetical protein [Burkholderia contaminans]|uniref:hypothetical protein n=1 Tax=Burkholderia contaminans TaxID=488447 RepID=UPI00158C09FD|nr:hypothetical protein [Burkholderia contaminans]
MINIRETLKLVDEAGTLERLTQGYKENKEYTITNCLRQIEEANLKFVLNELPWTEFLESTFHIADLHLRATLKIFGNEDSIEDIDDKDYFEHLLECYASEDREVKASIMLGVLGQLEDADTALRDNSLGWQSYLYDIREICRHNYEALYVIATSKSD